MKIQSLSIAVPASCPNQCKFCVAEIHRGEFRNQIEENTPFFDLYERDYIQRMEYARDNGVNSVILTGDGEPLMNKGFLKFFANCNKQLSSSFKQVELQTSGALLDEKYLRFLRNTIGVSIISLSLSALIEAENDKYNSPKNSKYRVCIRELCELIKKYDFSLRLSLNLTDYYDDIPPESIFKYTKDELGADQLTFRVLYDSGGNAEQDKWIQKHRCSEKALCDIRKYIELHGRPLYKLPRGAVKYSIHGMSVVVDEDCMDTEVDESLKYLILRQNCKLYSKWDDKGSLLF